MKEWPDLPRMELHRKDFYSYPSMPNKQFWRKIQKRWEWLERENSTFRLRRRSLWYKQTYMQLNDWIDGRYQP